LHLKVSLKARNSKTTSPVSIFDSFWPALTDMVHGSGAEPWVETLGTQGLEILYDPGPQVQHIVPEKFQL
jgi:hypothetical protein